MHDHVSSETKNWLRLIVVLYYPSFQRLLFPILRSLSESVRIEHIPKKCHFEDDFPFPKVGYVDPLEGKWGICSNFSFFYLYKPGVRDLQNLSKLQPFFVEQVSVACLQLHKMYLAKCAIPENLEKHFKWSVWFQSHLQRSKPYLYSLMQRRILSNRK